MANEMSLSIDGESIPFTMQAEVGHMTIEEAIASGFFDLPDEPGMVRIPVSLNVWIPNSILYPQAPPPPPQPLAGPPPIDRRDGVPRGGISRGRFGNYPKAIAAQNVARTFQSPAQAQAERDEFRAILDVLHPRRGPRAPDGPHAPDGTPILRVADEEPEVRRGEDGRELTPLEAARLDSYNLAYRELLTLEPHYTEFRPYGWVPDDAAVARIEAALRDAQARAAAKASTAPDAMPPAIGNALMPTVPKPDPSTDNPFGQTDPPPAQPFPTGTPRELPDATQGPSSTNIPNAAEATNAPSAPDSNTAPSPPIRLEHILQGDVSAGKARGFHFRPGGEDPPTARMTTLRDKPNRFGIYTGNVKVKDPVTGEFILKGPLSTFFPDSFTKEQVVEVIETAFRNSGLKGEGEFIGDSGFGFEVEGSYSKKDGIKTAYPIWEDK